MNTRFTRYIFISLIIHFSVFLFVEVQSVTREHDARLHRIEFIEEKEDKEKEEEKKIKEPPQPISQPEPTKSIVDALRDRLNRQKIDPELEAELKKLYIVRPMEVAPPDAKIDIGKIQELADIQATINLNSYEAIDVTGDVEVVRIGSESKSINEILEEPSIALPKTREDLDAKVGLFTSPGSKGQIIELEKVDISELKDDSHTADFSKKKITTEIETTPEKKTTTEVEIAGALAERKLLEKPLSSYPDWALKRGLSAVVTVRVTVGPDGKPKPGMLIIHTSGYSNWDNLVMKTLEKWRWESCPITHTGTITFRFILVLGNV